MTVDPITSLVRHLDYLSEDDLLRFHREVCRRAAAIYKPRYQAKRDANWTAGMHASQSQRNARRATPSRV